jgi:hypothetical protein
MFLEKLGYEYRIYGLEERASRAIQAERHFELVDLYSPGAGNVM